MNQQEPLSVRSLVWAAVAFPFVLTLVPASLLLFKADTGPNASNGTLIPIAQEHVRNALMSPTSAVFPPASAHVVIRPAPGMATVHGHVDAKNAFGTPLRKEFTAKLHYLGDQWLSSGVEFQK
jgi:hypothetical protein